MAEHGFTPGPLEVDGFADCQLITKDVPAAMDRPIGIAKVYGPNMIGDARLFAASPTLLEAVQNLMGLFDNAVYRMRLKDDALYPEVIQHARAAITLATGKDA